VNRHPRDNETYIRAHDEDGVPTVEYSMEPFVARELATILETHAGKDQGWSHDAAALFRAADEADEL